MCWSYTQICLSSSTWLFLAARWAGWFPAEFCMAQHDTNTANRMSYYNYGEK